MEEKTIKHYSSKHKILLVGEGDFSFSLCLAKAFGSATNNMVATSLESQDTLISKYSTSFGNLSELEKLGCTVLHHVDAHTLSKHPFLSDKLFDRIVFNFPQNESSIKIKSQQKLVMGFMRNAREILREDGEIHVTHRTTYPYSESDMETLGSRTGLYLKEEVPFHVKDYKGYSVKKGEGKKKFKVGESSTFIFIKDSSVQALSLRMESLTEEVSELRAMAVGSSKRLLH